MWEVPGVSVRGCPVLPKRTPKERKADPNAEKTKF
jgi:hypothetical protein